MVYTVWMAKVNVFWWHLGDDPEPCVNLPSLVKSSCLLDLSQYPNKFYTYWIWKHKPICYKRCKQTFRYLFSLSLTMKKLNLCTRNTDSLGYTLKTFKLNKVWTKLSLFRTFLCKTQALAILILKLLHKTSKA